MARLLIWFVVLLLCHFQGSTAGLYFNEEREDSEYSFLEQFFSDHWPGIPIDRASELNTHSAASVFEKACIQELNKRLNRIRSLLKPYVEVEYLWKASLRKEVYIQDLKDKILKAADNLNRLDLMNDMISEQSKQIQQLEEALQMAKMRVSNIEEKLKNTNCPVMKSIECSLQEFHKMWKVVLNFCDSNRGHALKSYISEASDHVNKTYTAAKYQLVDVIDTLLQLEDGKKLTVLGYDLTAEETASALIICIMGLLVLSILLVIL